MATTIFLPLAAELPNAHVFDATLALAKQLHAHVHATYIRPDPDSAAAMMPEMILAAGVTRDAIERESGLAAAAAEAAFEEWRQRHGAAAKADPRSEGWQASWAEQVGEYEPIVTRRGRMSDFIVLPRPTASGIAAQRCFDAAVFGTGRPSLLVGEACPPVMTDHIMIAWNGSLEASRAVFGAMPLLRHAHRVTIFTALNFGDEAVDREDLAAAFREHGIHTPEVVFPSGNLPTGEALVAAAAKHGATMIVMGAYTHSRLREGFLGGVTKHLLAYAPVPLLMSH